MKIAVIGAAGKAGSLIAKEALDRGHEVTAIVKPGSEDRVPKGCAILAKSLFDLTSADLKGFYAVLSTYILIATTSVEEICYALRILHVPKVIVMVILMVPAFLSM